MRRVFGTSLGGWRRWARAGLWCAAGLVVACAAPRQDVDDPSPDPAPKGPAPDDDREAPLGCRGEPCNVARPCPPDYACVDGACVASMATCRHDLDCGGDTRCARGACIAYDACDRLPPYRPACLQARFPEEALVTPEVRCHYRDLNATSVPVVADLDGDGRPEVVTQAFPNQIVALRPATCQPLWTRQLPLLGDGMGSLAVADLDADGQPEIVTLDDQARLLVLDAHGDVRARAAQPIVEWNAYSSVLWSAPTIADVDGQAPPEILAGGAVARFQPQPTPHVDIVWSHENKTAPWGSVPLAADLDGDGIAEVITSDRIFDGKTGVDKTPPMLADVPFFAQVADFNLDGRPDLLTVESRREGQVVRVFDMAARRTLFGPYRAGDGGWGGPAVIADFDGDGTPDFALGGWRWFYVYALRCADADPRPVGCMGHEPGLLWSRRIDDRSSGSAGAVAFDFNGDGAAEIVYRDECWLRIFSGLSGNTLAAYNITSSTGIETPTVADVDGDGHAEVIVTSDVDIDLFGLCTRQGHAEAQTMTPWTGWIRGLLILGDPMSRWMPARPLWNQHAYHVSNIADDLTVPVRGTPSWLRHNTFRTALDPAGHPPPAPRPLIDLTGHILPPRFPRDCTQPWTLSAQICNRGVAPAPAPVAATFYAAPPSAGGPPVCTATTATALSPGTCQIVGCGWGAPPTARTDLYLRVGDDGHGSRVAGQCRDDNDGDALLDLACFNAPN